MRKRISGSGQPRRILAFDSSCMTCSQVADEARRASNGRLEIRSLHDDEIKAILPADARMRPALITIDGDDVKVDVGATMGAKLTLMLGVRESRSLLAIIARESAPEGVSRRTVLGRGAAAVGTVLVGSGALSEVTAQAAPVAVTDAAVLGRLEHNAEVKRAVWTFGEPADVTLFRARPDVYVLEHRIDHSPPGWRNARVYTALDTKLTVAVSYRIGEADGKSTLHYMTTDAQALHTVHLNAAKGASASTINYTCLDHCYWCPNSSGYARIANCSYCAGCAGAKAIQCAFNCRGRSFSGGLESPYAFCFALCCFGVTDN